MDSTTWAALTVVLTVLGALWTWTAYRHRGAAAGTRALAWTLVPVALGLTGTLHLAGDIVGDVTHWATGLVFSPVVWAGIATGGLSAALFLVSGWMLGRASGKGVAALGPSDFRRLEARTPAPERHDEAALDDDVAAILRKHGIN